MVGTEILNYIIEREIRPGGMASVYLARHKTLTGIHRAIKVLHPSMALDAGMRARFLTEADTMARLDHPNIAKVHDYMEQGGNLFLVMEYCEGIPMDELIRFHTGPIPEERAKTIMSRILDAIGYAHSKGVIHRDIKPSNIIIMAEDKPKVIDFGIVKILEDATSNEHTKTGTRIGTPIFMSPEQIVGKGIDRRSDIYALGVTLFQMITARSPYDVTLSEYEIQYKIMNEPLPRIADFYPAASAHIQAVLDKATAKKKEDRFDTCDAFRAALADPAFGDTGQGVIRNFTADRESLNKGETAILTWETIARQPVELVPIGKTGSASGTYKVTPVATTTYILKADGEERQIKITVKNRSNKAGWWIGLAAGLILLLVLGGTVRDSSGDTFFDRMRAGGTSSDPPIIEMNPAPPATDTPVTGTTAMMDTLAPAPAVPAPMDTSSNTTTASANTISEYDRERIRLALKSYYEADNAPRSYENIETLCNSFAFPTDYFNSSGISREQLHDICKTQAGKLSYYNMNVSMDNIVFRGKNAYGRFFVDIPGVYQSRKVDEELVTRDVVNHFIFSPDYKIESIH